MNGRRGNRPNNNSFNSRRGNNNQYRQGQSRGGPGPAPRRAGGGHEYNVANIDNGVEFVLASVEAIQRTPKKFSFADRLAKSHEDRITEHLKTGAQQTITVGAQHDAFDQLFNDVSDSSSDEGIDDTVMASEDELNGFDEFSLTSNMSGASELFNECALFNSEGTSTHPLDNELRDTSSSKADELTLDASIPAELDNSFDQSNNDLFKKQDDEESQTDTMINRWQEQQRVGPREHNPNMFCESCKVYGHTQGRCARKQAIESLNQWLARSSEPEEADSNNNGQDQETEHQEDENIFQIDINQDDTADTDAHGNNINPDDDVYDEEYTITSGSTGATEASTSHSWNSQDEDSIVQVRNKFDSNISIGPLPDEVAITHEEVLPTYDTGHPVYGKQDSTVSQTTEGPLNDTGATLHVTQIVTPERRASAPASDTSVQRALRQGWTTTGSDVTKEDYARRISLPVAQQVANKVMMSGPHMADPDALQKLINKQREHNDKVWKANKESLDRGEAFLRFLELEKLIDAQPKIKPELLLSNVDFTPPNDAERRLGYALFMCPNECRQVWFKLRQLSATTKVEGATLEPLSPEINRERVCTANCRQMWQQMATLAEQQGTPFPSIRNGVPDFCDGQHPDE